MAAWFFEQLLPGSALYNISFAARLRFNLDLRLFKRALEVVVGRHEMLRTVFAVEQEEPAQVVLEHVDVPIRPCDLRQLPPCSVIGSWRGSRPSSRTRHSTSRAARSSAC